MATEYFDGLSDEDAAALETAFGDQDAILTGKGPDADALSGIIHGAPAIGKETTIYRYYNQSNLPTDSPLHTFIEPGFIVGSTVKPAAKIGADIFAFKVPSGVKALQIDGEHYIFDRGLTVAYTPSASDTVPATAMEWFPNGKALVAGGVAIMKFNTGYIPPLEERETIEEFYNHAHGRGGRFAPSGGSSSGGGGGQSTHQGNQGQHQRHGQGGQGNRPQGKFVGVSHGGNRPPQGGKPKLTKPEEHLHRTANIVRSVVAIATVVVTAAAIINAVGNLGDVKGSKVQRQANRARNEETVRKSKPQFKSKEDEGVFNYLNPSGKFIKPNPERSVRHDQKISNIS